MSEAEQTNPELEEELAEKGNPAGLVLLSIFIFALVGALVAMPLVGEKDPELVSKMISAEWLVDVTGNFHPLMLHLPIGIVFLVVAMEVISWLSFGRYRPKTGLALFLGVVTGAFACFTGYVSWVNGGESAEKWGDHMWGGIIFVGVLGLAYLAKLWGARNQSHGPVYGILLLGAFGALGYGAHLGGENVHGTDPVTDLLKGMEILPAEEPEEIEVEAESEVVEGEKVSKGPEDRLAYAEVVVPILESKCYDCHAVGKKKKGGLLMDSWEGLLEGGDEAEALVPGDPEKSFMIETISLPKDDDYHMPPPKKPQLEEYEKELLIWWVSNLPKSDVLKDQTLKEMNAPANIIEAASKMMSPEELAAAKKAEEEAKKAAEAESAAKREALDGAIHQLKQSEEFQTALNYLSQDSTELEFTAVSLREAFGDEAFLKLSPVAESLSIVKLGSTSVSEDTLIAELPKMKNLQKLDLSQMQIGDRALEAVVQLDQLEWLNLYGTQVTDEGIAKLKSLPKLEKLYLWNSQATQEGAEALKKELPNLEFFFGVN